MIKIKPDDTLPHSNLGKLHIKLGNLEGASEEVEKSLRIDKNNADALILDGRIKIEKKDYLGAVESFKKAIPLKIGDPLLLLWDAYANYLRFEFSSNLTGENIASIIRKLEKAEELYKVQEEEETRGYILYFLGYFDYKIKDVFTAKERLEECVRLKSKVKTSAGKLLDNIWIFHIRPTWMEWWLASSQHCWIKGITFFILLISIITL